MSIRVGLIGVSGYAAAHRRYIEECGAHLAAVVIRVPYAPGLGEEQIEAELRTSGVRVYRTYQEMFAAEQGELELIGVPVGIPYHEEISVAALAEGFNVLCEKPAAGSLAEVDRMIAAAKDSPGFLSIGFQNIASASIQRIAADVGAGKYGALVRAKGYGVWPRGQAYYGRNEWAGALECNGRAVYDSPLQNAMAHFLMNMLFIAGVAGPGVPGRVAGENFRAKPIGSADTQFIRVTTDAGAELEFWATHAARVSTEPGLIVECEEAVYDWVYRSEAGWGVTTVRRAGIVIDEFSNGTENAHTLSYSDAIGAIVDGRAPSCPITAARAHMYCIEELFRVAPVREILPDFRDGDGYDSVVRGMEDGIARAHAADQSFAESGLDWVR